MTKYAKLKAMKDNFIHAACTAKNNFMLALWTYRASEVQKQIDKLSMEEAMEECQND